MAKQGRPTKYKSEYCKAIIEFFSIEPTKEIDVVTTFKNGTTRETTEERPNHIPFFADFAAKIGVTDATVVNWTKKHEEFLSAYMRAKALQKQHLITCGLLGLYNPKFAIFTAINITDMRDKQIIEHEETEQQRALSESEKAEANRLANIRLLEDTG